MISFANPLVLWGLVALAIPIIIHLFNFRKYVKILFPDLRFLKSILQESQSKSKLRHLIILCCRLLFFALLILAFSQPFISRHQTNKRVGARTVSIYIDNSFSMDARGKRGSLLEEAKLAATEIVMSYSPGDLYQIITSEMEGRHQRLVHRDQALELISEVKLAPVSRSLNFIYERQKEALKASGSLNKDVYILSDFQKSQFSFPDVKTDSGIHNYFIPLESQKKQNLYIDSCWFQKPVRQFGQTETLYVRIRNNSDKDFEKIPLKLFINEKQKALAGVDVPSEGSVDIPLTWISNTIGVHSCRLQITDYPIVFDDQYYFSYQVDNKIKVLTINDANPNRHLSRLLSVDSILSVTESFISQLDMSLLKQNNLIILSGLNKISEGVVQELSRFVDHGGSLIIIPGKKIESADYNKLTGSIGISSFGLNDSSEMKADFLNMQHPLFKDVFAEMPKNMEMPDVFEHYSYKANSKVAGEVVIQLQNGNPFLIEEKGNKAGKIYVFTAPLDLKSSNFMTQALCVPVFLKMAYNSLPFREIAYKVGAEEPIDGGAENESSDKVYQVENLNGKFSFIPGMMNRDGKTWLYVGQQMLDAGNYLLKSSDKLIGALSFNYSRQESKMDYWSQSEINEMSDKYLKGSVRVLSSEKGELKKAIQEEYEGIQLWKWFVLAALFFLLIEMILLRFFK